MKIEGEQDNYEVSPRRKRPQNKIKQNTSDQQQKENGLREPHLGPSEES
jgi:hypothetical protein